MLRSRRVVVTLLAVALVTGGALDVHKADVTATPDVWEAPALIGVVTPHIALAPVEEMVDEAPPDDPPEPTDVHLKLTAQEAGQLRLMLRHCAAYGFDLAEDLCYHGGDPADIVSKTALALRLEAQLTTQEKAPA